MTYQQIFDRLWKQYVQITPEAQNIFNLFKNLGNEPVNDHIAYRTFRNSKISVDVIAKPFLDAGYEQVEEYDFEQKKLYAKHYEHKTDKNAPRVFISELLVEKFSEPFQKLVQDAIEQIPTDLISSNELIFSGSVFGKPSYETYEALRKESEYAAWLYVYGFRANHFTVSVNNLKTLNKLEDVNSLLVENGFKMNNSGGEIKGSPAEFLEQSSIMAEIISMEFEEGTYKIPSCFYEFALRYAQKDGELYSGFIAKSADKIFESTNFYS